MLNIEHITCVHDNGGFPCQLSLLGFQVHFKLTETFEQVSAQIGLYLGEGEE